MTKYQGQKIIGTIPLNHSMIAAHPLQRECNFSVKFYRSRLKVVRGVDYLKLVPSFEKSA